MLDLTGYKLTFSEEFNIRSISSTGDGTRWQTARDEWRMADGKADIGFGKSSFLDPSSGYDPFKVANGELVITAQPDKTPYGYPGSWESGLITTQGNFAQKYGYFEMRADMSSSSGGWDAFWLLPNGSGNPDGDNDWTELDIVEHYGAYDKGTYRWIHTNEKEQHPNPNQTLQVFSDNPEQTSGYHTYGVNWTPTSLDFYFDGKFMGSRPTPSDYHDPMYIIANLAVQGSDLPSGATSLQPMKIDYIRAFSNDPSAMAVKQETVSAPDSKDPGLYGATTAGNTTPAAPDPTVPTTPTTPTGPSSTRPETTRTFTGTDGADRFIGTSANDLIVTKGGDDKIWGGGGSDVIFTGSGRDAITFDTKIGVSKDVIVDFDPASDLIRLNDSIFSKLSEGELRSSWFRAGTKALDANDYVVYDQGTGKLFYDADGSGSGAAIHFATLENKAKLTAADFYVI